MKYICDKEKKDYSNQSHKMSIVYSQRFSFDDYQDYDPSNIYYFVSKYIDNDENAHIQCFDIPSNVDLRFDILYPDYEIQIVAISQINYSTKRRDVKVHFKLIPDAQNHGIYNHLMDYFQQVYSEHIEKVNDDHQSTLKNEYRYF